MKFRTEIIPQASKYKLDYQTPVLFLGSCFTDNIGSLMQKYLFPVNINPFGVVYNPVSVFKSLKYIIENKEFKEDDLFQHEDLWHSWYHHSSFSSTNKSEVVDNINNEICYSHEFLKNAKAVILTFGTSWIYRLKASGKIVSNCHKVPAAEFYRELLSVPKIVEEFTKIEDLLKKLNPDVRVIFTVSPVRHWKDGANGNQVSKSILHLSIHNILQIEKCSCEYFPAYEYLLDDLRDYRFYADDLLHPNKLAIDYIWGKFQETFFDNKTQELLLQMQKLSQASEHRLFQPDTENTRKFLMKQFNIINEIKEKYPFIDIDPIEKKFKDLMSQ